VLQTMTLTPVQERMRDEWLRTGVITRRNTDSHKEWFVKKHLLNEQHDCCALCCGPNEWNGAELVFILDHVDGNSDNNARENLRLVCPNCNSQLPTFAARNRGSGRHYRRERYAQGKSF